MSLYHYIEASGQPGAADVLHVLVHVNPADVPHPPNDNFADAEVLSTSLTGSTTGHTAGATTEVGEPNPTEAHPDGPFSTIWYEWTPASSGYVRFDTFGSLNYLNPTYGDTVMAVYTGTALNNLVEVVSNDEFDNIPPYEFTSNSGVGLLAASGTTYYIQVSVWYPGEESAIVLNWAPYVIETIRVTKHVNPAYAPLPRAGVLHASVHIPPAFDQIYFDEGSQPPGALLFGGVRAEEVPFPSPVPPLQDPTVPASATQVVYLDANQPAGYYNPASTFDWSWPGTTTPLPITSADSGTLALTSTAATIAADLAPSLGVIGTDFSVTGGPLTDAPLVITFLPGGQWAGLDVPLVVFDFDPGTLYVPYELPAVTLVQTGEDNVSDTVFTVNFPAWTGAGEFTLEYATAVGSLQNGTVSVPIDPVTGEPFLFQTLLVDEFTTVDDLIDAMVTEGGWVYDPTGATDGSFTVTTYTYGAATPLSDGATYTFTFRNRPVAPMTFDVSPTTPLEGTPYSPTATYEFAFTGGELPGDTPALRPVHRIYKGSSQGVKGALVPAATAQKILWTTNDAGSLTFSIGTSLTSQADLPPMRSEVQLWRETAYGERHLGSGVVYRPAGDENMMTFTCPDPYVYMQRRVLGPPNRIQYARNPNFATDLGSWTPFNIEGTASYNRITSDAVVGGSSLRIGCLTDQNHVFMQQSRDFAADPYGLFPYSVYVKAWFKVLEFNHPAYGNRGLAVNRLAGTNPGDPPTISRQIEVVEITGDTPKNVWIRAEVNVQIHAPGRDHRVQVRLYGCDGVILWGGVGMYLYDALGWYYGQDVGYVARDYTNHAQDPRWLKDDVGIHTDLITTGVGIQSRTDGFHEHNTIADAYGKSAGIPPITVDTALVYDGGDPTRRHIKQYYPQRGTAKPSLALEHNVDFFRFQYNYDGASFAKRTISLSSDSSGPAREEGTAVGVGLESYPTFEHVESMPPNTPVNELDNRAALTQQVKTHPQDITVTITDPERVEYFLLNAEPGDSLPLTMDWGYVSFAAQYVRIRTMELDCVNNTLTLHLLEALS